jgi:hypothetical protein
VRWTPLALPDSMTAPAGQSAIRLELPVDRPYDCTLKSTSRTPQATRSGVTKDRG